MLTRVLDMTCGVANSWDWLTRSCQYRTSWLEDQQLKRQQTPLHHLLPSTRVPGLTNPFGPEMLRIPLHPINMRCGDALAAHSFLMIRVREMITKDEGNMLPFSEVEMNDHGLAQVGASCSFKQDLGSGVLLIDAIEGSSELQDNILGLEDDILRALPGLSISVLR